MASMSDYGVFLLLGTGAGAVYAALGLGLVLTYRASGVVNLAHGAMAMYATYLFAELRGSGAMATAPAMALAVSAAGGFSAAAYAVVFRPLRSSPPLAGVVASVGLTVALQALAVLQFGTANRSVQGVLPARPVEVAGAVVPSDRLLLGGLVVVVAVALWALGRFTRLGLAARAASENELGAMALGWSPDALATGSWAAAGMIGAVGGILVGPITQLNPATYTLLVVPALAAALVGRLSSFGLTTAAALALGMAQSEIVLLQDRFAGLPRFGLGAGLPLIVVVVTLAVRGRPLPGRGAATPASARGLPVAGVPKRPLAVAGGLAAATALALVVLPGAYRLGLINSLVAALVCLSLVVLTGYAGQVSLAQMAFAGVAGFTLSRLADGIGLAFPVAPLLAAGASGLAGLALGVPALRVRGVNLALATVAAAVAMEELVFKGATVAGGLEGSPVPGATLFGVDLGIGASSGSGQFPRPAFGLTVLLVVVVMALGVVRLRTAGLGHRLLAVRANEAAAAALGVDVAATKLAAFGLSAFMAGLAGALIGYQQGQLSAESFGVFVSLAFLAVAYVGGIVSVAGALVGGALVAGGIVFTTLDRLVGLGRYQLLISGLALTAVVVLAPQGLAGVWQRRR